MSPIAVPADRRFRRAHLKPGRKRRPWRSIAGSVARYGVVAAVVILGAHRGATIAARARLLQVENIVVRGNDRLPRGDVLAVLTGLRGESLLWTDLDKWRRRLLASPWVRDAALRRSLPSTVEVVVLERQPIAIGRISGDLYLVDDSGVIIDQVRPQHADLDLPIIDGLSPRPGADPAISQRRRAELAGRVIAALKADPAVSRRLSQVDVSDPHDASVLLAGDPAVIHLGEDRFLPRLQSYLDLATALHERVADIDHVDVRFDDRIFVRPARRAGIYPGAGRGKTP